MMIDEASWDKFYRETALEDIPWNKTQADWLVELLDAGKLGSGLALDLGCGVGMKSILLAENGFDVVGIEISQRAVEYAKENANKKGLKIKFLVGDATDLSFLGDVKFDLVVDWAVLHCIDEEKREQYTKEVVGRVKNGGKFV
ncbi:class I SAM-dependent methyltransferase [Patescibacteria group bacterium]|nr:class I SAM-dependent methyltransferase [Patescibacteria group bacterium]